MTARENAYRANNIGVARLEQYDFPAAIAAFRRALEIDPALSLARLNLGIALFYGGEPEAARKELEAAKTALPDRPQPDYVLGLIARAADRTDDAVSAFTRVRELDPADVGAAINLGQLLVQQRRFDEAIKLLRPAVEAEPFNATAAYGLATALVRSGATDEGRAAMDKFQKLRESGYAVTFSQAYLEQGRYAEAIASTGAEAGLVNDAMPDVRFVDLGSVATYPAAADPGGLTLADLDGDGDVDLVDAGRQRIEAVSQRQRQVHRACRSTRRSPHRRPPRSPATPTTTAMPISSCCARRASRCCARRRNRRSSTPRRALDLPRYPVPIAAPPGSTPITMATSIC